MACLALLCLAIAFNVRASHAHSYILQPRGDYKSFRLAECRVGGPPMYPDDKCRGPCIKSSHFQYDANVRPTKFERGQRVYMQWARNNHRGGFVRFSLVPEKQRMNVKAHDAMAFRYACFESGRHKCTLNNCGTDKRSLAYGTYVEIPTSLQDGDYILGWAWYGGTESKKSLFGDYYSCLPVTIRGGPLTDTYDPVFIPGEKLDGRRTCFSATDKLGPCYREPCVGLRGKEMVPSQFANGGRPNPIKF